MRVLGSIAGVVLLVCGASVAAEDPPTDPGWPRLHAADGNEMVVFQPQVESWKDRSVLELVAAIAVTPAGQPTVYGILRVKANTLANFRNRTVLCTEIVPEAGFPNLEEEQAAPLRELALRLLPPRSTVIIDLDRILAGMERTDEEVKGVEVNLDPPPIYRSETPAILVIFMGKPRFEPVEGTGLEAAVNTNWDVFRLPDGSRYWLLHGESWLSATDPLKGPWAAVDALPEGLAKLPATDDWKDTRAHVPGKPATTVPRVVVSTTPAELILTDGAPEYAAVPRGRLMAVTNTECDLFLHSGEANFYYLVAGRWFRAKSLDGPWTAATTDLPPDFARIPPESDMGHVLASVPGTPEARDAILLASIPRMAAVDREEAKVEVAYDGEPKFEPIEGTRVSAAVNTPYDVIRAGDFYFCCYRGVWFVADAPGGPWAVCDEVPGAIYDIPPTCPKYPVTYVRVYDSTPETVVTGYTSGYSGEYVAAGILLFGLAMILADDDSTWYFSTGHYGYPASWYSYGCGARYDHWHGGYYRGMNYYGPYGGAGRGAVYNPRTGTWARGAPVYGPRGGGVAREAYNPWTGRYGARVGASNGYRSWGRSVVTDGDDWARAGQRSGPRGTVRGVETSKGGAAVGARTPYGRGFVAKDKNDNVYVGRDGHVYKRGESGNWKRYQGAGDWKKMDTPSAWSGAGNRVGATAPRARPAATGAAGTRGSLDRSFSSRQRANAASRRFGSRTRTGAAPARGYSGRR